MFEVTTESSFSAAHHLLNYNGPCEHIHGHNWLVRVSVWCERLNGAGIGIDFKVLKTHLRSILDTFDHADLNEVLPKGMNPSSENLAHLIFQKLQGLLDCETCRVARVEVFETPGNSATYFEAFDA